MSECVRVCGMCLRVFLTLHISIESPDECRQMNHMRRLVLVEDGLAGREVTQVPIGGGQEHESLVQIGASGTLRCDDRANGLADQTGSAGHQHDMLSRRRSGRS